MNQITTFPRREEFEKARACLDRLALACTVVSSQPAYMRVGVDGLILEQEARAKFVQETGGRIVCSGWVDYQPTKIAVPSASPPAFEEDLIGTCAIMVMAPCVADLTKIRLWNGEAKPSRCAPIFSGEHGHLKAPFLEICSSLGLAKMALTEPDE